ncbi:MAG: hypothetical protein ABI851_02895 [Saprospiraceae bacterium]
MFFYSKHSYELFKDSYYENGINFSYIEIIVGMALYLTNNNPMGLRNEIGMI